MGYSQRTYILGIDIQHSARDSPGASIHLWSYTSKGPTASPSTPPFENSCSLCLGLCCFCALSCETDIGLDERLHSRPIESYSFSTAVHHYPISSPKLTRPTPQACPTIHLHALARSPPLSLSLISSTLLGTILPLPSPSDRSSSASFFFQKTHATRSSNTKQQSCCGRGVPWAATLWECEGGEGLEGKRRLERECERERVVGGDKCWKYVALEYRITTGHQARSAESTLSTRRWGEDIIAEDEDMDRMQRC